MTDFPNLPTRQGILSITIKDRNALYSAYMPYLKHGGLFIPTTKSYQLGDEVRLLITLMEEPERLAITGKVVWITPVAAHNNRVSGIGVQLTPQEGVPVRTKIENYLAEMLHSERPTHTL